MNLKLQSQTNVADMCVDDKNIMQSRVDEKNSDIMMVLNRLKMETKKTNDLT